MIRFIVWILLYVALHVVMRGMELPRMLVPVVWLVLWWTWGKGRRGGNEAEAPVKPARRRWALALADILLRRNDLPCGSDALPMALTAERRKSLREAVLNEFGISPKLDDAAARHQVLRALRAWPQGARPEDQEFHYRMAVEGKVRDAIAFQVARVAFLVRCAAALQLCDEQRAWMVLLLNAQRAQDTFQSWQDFGDAYARARAEWLTSREGATTSQRARLEVAQYLADPRSNWCTLPWSAYRIFDPQPLAPQTPSPSP